jgi:hypothetical protein
MLFINASILAFPFIETVNLKFTVDFFLSLRWYDTRIDFRDLNNVSSLNALGQNHMSSLWTPSLSFINALGPYQTTVDALTSGHLIREHESLSEDYSLANEGIGEFDQLDPSVARAGFAPASEVAGSGGHTLPF